ncbi:hypothetical protein MKX08_000298 [Trichoderma sp. CBMAI-0020]|nr:hypothetical protein MKX08_000298 [Trichoderma sp. CBMAI-0020]
MTFTIKVIARHDGSFATLSRATHKPLYSVEAANAILQTLLIFSDASNRVAIEQELSFLSSLRPDDPIADHDSAHRHISDISRDRPRSSFPFINTCGLRDAYIMERLGTLGDNDISNAVPPFGGDPYRHYCVALIDITNLDGLRYGFVAQDGITLESVQSYLARAPKWVTEEQGASEEQVVAQALARFELMTDTSVLPVVGNPERNVPPRPARKSLVDLCIAKLPHLFQSFENIDITDYEVLQVPHIKTLIWEYCLEIASRLPTCPALLALALKGETHISFAQLSKLAPDAVRHVLRSCPEALSINLSGTAAMADDEIEETLAAIDHDLDALYLLTHPHEIAGTLPKEVMRALRNWNHRCSKVLISSVLAEGSRGPAPISLISPRSHVLHQMTWNRTHCVGSKSFPITQIIYQSTFNNPYQPAFAHVFLGGGFVSPPRLWTTWGSPTVGSDKFYEVHSIPVEASFAVYYPVVLRDVVHQDPPPQDGLNTRNATDRFRILLLRPKNVIIVGESQSISTASFRIRTYSSFLNLGPSEATQVLICDQRRTMIQFQTAPQDVADAVSAVQMVLNAAAAARNVREMIEKICLEAKP